MKKFALIFYIILSIICTSLIAAPMVNADTSTYYETTENLQTYLSNESPAVIIPYTYFFKLESETTIISESNIEYYKIVYNGISLYAKKTDVLNKATQTSSSDISSPYYTMNLTLPSGFTTKYKYNQETDTFKEAGSEEYTSMTFIGYVENDSKYYFYVSATYLDGEDITQSVNIFVLSSDVVSTFSASAIPLHPSSNAAKEKNKQDNNKIAQNNLKRNIFFFSICVLCVIVVVIIYNPFKKKGSKNTQSQFKSEEDY